jgi:hypothetical protein
VKARSLLHLYGVSSEEYPISALLVLHSVDASTARQTSSAEPHFADLSWLVPWDSLGLKSVPILTDASWNRGPERTASKQHARCLALQRCMEITGLIGYLW